MITSDNIDRYWMIGTTCSRHIECQWVSDCKQYALMWHKSHSEWCGRFSGNQNCEASRTLVYIPSTNEGNTAYGFGGLSIWLGRWSKSRHEELMERVSEHKLFLEGKKK